MSPRQGLMERIQPLDEPQFHRDFVLLFVVPSVVLLVVYLFPQSEQVLEYEARNPTLIGIVGSNLAHRSSSHISSNIIGYWILGGVAFLLMRATGLARVYRYSLVAYVLILPFFANWTILQIFSDRPDIIARFESVGFSQTVGAITGILPIAISYYQSRLTGGNYALQLSLGLFALGFSVAFYNLGQTSSSVIILAGVGVLSVLIVVYRLTESVEHVSTTELAYLGSAFVFFILGVQSLFPPSAPAGIYGHMAGYVWGYVLPVSGIAIAMASEWIRSRT